MAERKRHMARRACSRIARASRQRRNPQRATPEKKTAGAARDDRVPSPARAQARVAHRRGGASASRWSNWRAPRDSASVAVRRGDFAVVIEVVNGGRNARITEVPAKVHEHAHRYRAQISRSRSSVTCARSRSPVVSAREIEPRSRPSNVHHGRKSRSTKIASAIAHRDLCKRPPERIALREKLELRREAGEAAS